MIANLAVVIVNGLFLGAAFFAGRWWERRQTTERSTFDSGR